MPREKIYDGEKLFRAWCGWGAAATGTRLREYAKANFGGTSQMGAEYAMWKWAFNNVEEAFPLWKEMYFEKHPDLEQPTFEDFAKLVLRRARGNQNVGGSKKRLNRFCAKYGLEYEIRIGRGDIVQVTRRNHPLFQALLIVDKVIDNKSIEAFLTNEDGTRSVYTLKADEVGVIGKAIFERKQGVVTKGNISRIPILEGLARNAWMPLKKIEVDEDGVQKKYRFVYRKGNDEMSIVYFDLDNGVDEEILRLRNLKESSGEPAEETV